MRFRPYAEYRDSGVEWLGPIPAHWGTRRLKYSAPLVVERSDEADPELPYVALEHIEPQAGRLNLEAEASVDDDVDVQGASLRFKPGDVLFGKLRPYLAKVVLATLEGRCSSELLVLRSREGVAPRALSYQLLSAGFIAHINAMTYGTKMPRANPDQVSCAAITIAPLAEQQAIASFLDRETARIDALVAKNERLIGLLQEKRAALITQAVTKGLDPNVHMKDSGVEWLGEIPAHWRIAPLKTLLRRCDYGISESPTAGGDIRVLTMAHIQNGEVAVPEEGGVNEVENRLFLDHGDLLFNRTNSRDLVAKVGMFRGSRQDRVTFASYLVRMTTRDPATAEWLGLLLNSSGLLGLARSMALLSVNQSNLNPTRYTQVAVPVPPTDEQVRIAEHLRQAATGIDALVFKVREGIDRIKEYRTALISAAVTGKIDVRTRVA